MGSYHPVLVRPLKMEENRHLLGELERCLGERRRLEMLEECALLERCRALQAEHAASEADAARQQENIARSLYLEMERGAHDAHRLEREHRGGARAGRPARSRAPSTRGAASPSCASHSSARWSVLGEASAPNAPNACAIFAHVLRAVPRDPAPPPLPQATHERETDAMKRRAAESGAALEKKDEEARSAARAAAERGDASRGGQGGGGGDAPAADDERARAERDATDAAVAAIAREADERVHRARARARRGGRRAARERARSSRARLEGEARQAQQLETAGRGRARRARARARARGVWIATRARARAAPTRRSAPTRARRGARSSRV